MSDVRARRAERARQNRWRASIAANGKYVVIAVVLLAAVGAAATLYKPPPASRFIHEHPTFAVFIDGTRVPFTNAAYDASQAGMDRFHMHQGQGFGEVLHVEGKFPGGMSEVTLGEVWRRFGLEFRQGYMRLDDAPPQNGTEWPDRADARWRVYVSKKVGDERGPFEEVRGDYAAYAIGRVDKVLVTYGSDAFLTPSEFQRQQAAIAASPDDRA